MDIKELVSEMTLEEKAGLCSGKNFWETKPVERLGIPSILMTDGPHGLRKIVTGPETGDRQGLPATCFPPAVLNACSFDRELLKEMGEAIADECVAGDISIVLGPGVNIKRSPLCGRNFEYFSEDPYLAGEMAVSFINGVQSKGVGTSLKHYAANNQETRRWSSDSQIDERTLREIYFPAFKKAVEESQPATVMCSYNKVNGEYASESYRLLTEILRNEWGFEGIVVSDWGAVNDRVKGIIAGLELEMPGVAVPSNDEYIIKAVRSGELPEASLDLAVERLLNVILDLSGDERHCGKYRRGENREVKSAEAKAVDRDKHNRLARKIASESMVLLKNDDKLLPLSKDANIVFIGEFAENPRYQGAGSSRVTPTTLTTALVAAKEYARIKYCKGYSITKCDESDDALQAEAVATAMDADVCVLFIGLPPAYESEGYDRTHMHLPGGQNSLIEAVAKVNKNIVVVLHNGSPVEMPWSDNVSAILEAYLGGQAGGGAVADILFGESNPCGKLAESMPIKLSDNPSYLYYIGEHDVTEYREGIFVGYRYYDTKEMKVLFPFGHGLSYTTFKYSNLRLSKSSIKDTEKLEVTADITNTGTVAGKEIVQLYVGPKYGGSEDYGSRGSGSDNCGSNDSGLKDCGPWEKDDRLIRADKELRDFTKVALEPGETKSISFTLDKSAFTYYNTKIKDFHVLSGVYKIMLGRSSRDIAAVADVSVESTVKIPFRADVNTTVRDIVRMENGEAFLNEVKKLSPMYAKLDTNPEPDSLEYMRVKAIPEMVLRQVRLMGQVPGKSLEEIQKLVDDTLND